MSKSHMRRLLAIVYAIIVLTFVGRSLIVSAQSSDSFRVEDGVVSSGGGISTSDSFQVYSIINPLGSVQSSSSSFIQNPGTAFTPIATSPLLSVTAGDAQLDIDWTAAVATFASVTEYRVGISTSENGSYDYSSTGLTRNKLYTGLTNDQDYFIKVQVYDGDYLLTTSDIVVGTPVLEGDGSHRGRRRIDAGYASLVVEGYAYPKSRVVILRDGLIVAESTADMNAQFRADIGQAAGDCVYTVYAVDYAGRRSSPISFTVGLFSGRTTIIGGLFLPPTVDVSRYNAARGETISIVGQTAPRSVVDISIYPEMVAMQTRSGNDGMYFYQLNTASLEPGMHEIRARGQVGGLISAFGDAVRLTVSATDIVPEEPSPGEPPADLVSQGDLNEDKRVDLVDLSIAAFWYLRPLSPEMIVLEKRYFNGDGKIDLTDLSIMAYYWTG